jgi:hypothetical protein
MNVSLYRYPLHHGLINYIDTNAKCRHLKKLTCKETLRQVFIRVFIEWRCSQSCWYFRHSFMNCFHSNLVSGSTLPPVPPSFCQSIEYTDTMWLGRGGGVLSPVGDHILQEFNILYLTRFRTYKIARPPQTKHLPQSPLTCQFFR